MTVKEKLTACAIAAMFLIFIVAVYGYLVVSGKAPIEPFLALLGTLATVVIGLVSGLAGHAAGTGSAVSLIQGEAFLDPVTVRDAPAAGGAAPLPAATGGQ